MSTHQQRIKASEASRFMAGMPPNTEDWQAGGSFGDILTDLKREGHITPDLYIAGFRLIHDMTKCHGTSMGLTSQYGEQLDGSEPTRLPPHYIPDLDAFRRMDSVLGGLRQHERALLSYCVRSRDLPRGGLSDWGREYTGYETAKTARAATVGMIKAMLGSVYELYKLHAYPG